MIGEGSQAVVWREWYGTTPEAHAVLLTFEPLSATPRLRAEVERQFARVQFAKVLHYSALAGPRVDVYVTWCDNGPDGSAIVRP
jgi:hypothetical protein